MLPLMPRLLTVKFRMVSAAAKGTAMANARSRNRSRKRIIHIPQVGVSWCWYNQTLLMGQVYRQIQRSRAVDNILSFMMLQTSIWMCTASECTTCTNTQDLSVQAACALRNPPRRRIETDGRIQPRRGSPIARRFSAGEGGNGRASPGAVFQKAGFRRVQRFAQLCQLAAGLRLRVRGLARSGML